MRVDPAEIRSLAGAPLDVIGDLSQFVDAAVRGEAAADGGRGGGGSRGTRVKQTVAAMEEVIREVIADGTPKELQKLSALVGKQFKELQMAHTCKKLDKRMKCRLGSEKPRCSHTHYERSDYMCNLSAVWVLTPPPSSASSKKKTTPEYHFRLDYNGETSGEGDFSVQLPGATRAQSLNPSDVERTVKIPEVLQQGMAADFGTDAASVCKFIHSLLKWTGGWPEFQQ